VLASTSRKVILEVTDSHKEDTVISTTPAATSIPFTGTWFARVGLRPYELLGHSERTGGTRTPIRTLPRLDLAA
jgi:hypothetical protein